MTHEISEERLHEYLDDELSPAARVTVEEHLEVCERCREEVKAVRKLANRASSLARDIQPPRDFWPTIRARHAGVVPLPMPAGGRSRTGIERVRLASAAVLLILASSGVTALLLRTSSGDVTEMTRDAERGSAYLSSRSEEGLKADYIRAARELSITLEERRASLSPHTVRIVEQNLSVIDAAIRESSEALARDPGNRSLSQMVSNSYRQKVELLRQATQSLVEL